MNQDRRESSEKRDGGGAGHVGVARSSQRQQRQQSSTDKLQMPDGGGAMCWLSPAGEGLVLVDGGAPKSGDR